jgi:ferredoxin
MALKIIDECISCGACESECPNEAISEAECLYVIDPSSCTECYGFYGTQQCAEVCPVEACVRDDRYAETPIQLKEKFLSLHPQNMLANTDKWKASVL